VKELSRSGLEKPPSKSLLYSFCSSRPVTGLSNSGHRLYSRHDYLCPTCGHPERHCLPPLISEATSSSSTPNAPFPCLDQSEPKTSQEHQLLYSNVNAGWARFDKDYALTHLSASHVAAVDLHPVYAWRYPGKKWSTRPDWVREAEP
jgi:hypothetical protein